MSGVLFAPLDMARFAVAFVALALVPGYCLASLTRPCTGRLDRLAMAVPCGASAIALYGLCSGLLHQPFTLLPYAVGAAGLTLLTLAVAVYKNRLAHELTAPTSRWWIVPVAVTAIEAAVIAVTYARDVVPAAVDVLSHVLWTGVIRQQQVFTSTLLSAHPASGDGGFYPPLFHAVTALVAIASGVPDYRAVFYSAVAASLLLPLTLFCYTRATLGDPRLAALAAVASLAFEPLPSFALAQGLYPFVMSFLFIPALVLALADGLGRGRKGSVTLAALLGVGLFYLHPTEFVTVALLSLGVVLPLLRTATAWRRAVGYGVIVAAVWMAVALPAIAAVRRTMVSGAQVEIQTRHDFVATPRANLGSILDGYTYLLGGRNVSYALLIAALVGVAWCLAQRRHRALALTYLVLLAIVADVLGPNLLRPFYALSFPWALPERLAPTHYWVLLPLAAIGIDALGRAVRRQRWSHDRVLLALTLTPCIVLGLLLPLDVAVRHTMAYSAARRVVAPADLGALTWLQRHAGMGTVVVDDEDATRPDIFDAPIDAGRWMAAFAAGVPTFGQGGAGPGSWDDRVYLLRHIADAELPTRAARFIAAHHVAYVFYGAATPPGATRHLDLARLLKDPHLRLVYSNVSTGASYVFAIKGLRLRSHGSGRTLRCQGTCDCGVREPATAVAWQQTDTAVSGRRALTLSIGSMAHLVHDQRGLFPCSRPRSALRCHTIAVAGPVLT